MWHQCRGLVPLFVIGLAGFSSASAVELPESIARCAELADNLERLTCYDRQNPPRAPTSKAASQAPEALFGANAETRRKEPDSHPDIPREPDQITAKITRITEDRQGDARIELDNGQVWQQVQHRVGSIAETGDEVTISKGALSAYYLVGKARLSTKVKRVR